MPESDAAKLDWTKNILRCGVYSTFKVGLLCPSGLPWLVHLLFPTALGRHTRRVSPSPEECRALEMVLMVANICDVNQESILLAMVCPLSSVIYKYRTDLSLTVGWW